MADLKIPNLNKNSDKFFFKKKLFLRRKSKRKLKNEIFWMLSSSILIIYINYIIPNKYLIFNNLLNNLSKFTVSIFETLLYFYEICLAIFIVVSLIFALILILGAFTRIMRILKRKSRQINFK